MRGEARGLVGNAAAAVGEEVSGLLSNVGQAADSLLFSPRRQSDDPNAEENPVGLAEGEQLTGSI